MPVEKWQRLFSGLILVAILITAAAPHPRAGADRPSELVFALMESDYNTPFIGSYLWMRSLPVQSESFAGFAGYEQHMGRLRFGDSVTTAQVTRFAGNLIKVAGLQFLARKQQDRESNANQIYLSESFWREALGGSLQVLGQEVSLDGHPALITAIVAEPRDYFAGTQLWVPMRVSEPAARTESLRIIGRIRDGVSWGEAQKELTRLTRRQSFPLSQLVYCKMIPASEPITFTTLDRHMEMVSRQQQSLRKDS